MQRLLSLVNLPTSQMHTYGPNKINVCFASLEDKFNVKISSLNLCLTDEIDELNNKKKL